MADLDAGVIPVRDKDRLIGMVMLRAGWETDYERAPAVYPVGCAGFITHADRLPDGRYNIALAGLVKFRVTAEDNSRPYRVARVTAMPEELDPQETVSLAKERQRLEDLLLALFDRLGMELPPAASDKQAVDVLSQYLPIDPLSRQRLLEQDDSLSRAMVLGTLLEAIVKKQ